MSETKRKPEHRPLLPANIKALSNNVSLLKQLTYCKTRVEINDEPDEIPQNILLTNLNILFGFGGGKLIEFLVTKLTPKQRILVVEPFPELMANTLCQHNVEHILNHPQINFFVGSIQEFLIYFNHIPAQLKALNKTEILAHPQTLNLMQQRKDPMYSIYKSLMQQLQKVKHFSTPQARMNALERLYEETKQQLNSLKQEYPEITCKSGCAECCKHGSGSTIFISPIEWEKIFYFIKEEMSVQERKALFWKMIDYLKEHFKDVIAYQQYINQHTITLYSATPAYQKLGHFTQNISMDSCPFLNIKDQCKIYSARPMVCRIFGYSYWQKKHVKLVEDNKNQLFERRIPYTCAIDHDKLIGYLKTQELNLFDARNQFHKITQLHGHYNKGNSIPNWLTLHLDLDKQDFVEQIKLNYETFDILLDTKKSEQFYQKIVKLKSDKPGTTQLVVYD